LELIAPFLIRSAMIHYGFNGEKVGIGFKELYGYLYDRSLQPDGSAPIIEAQSYHFVLQQDIRKRLWTNKPVDPAKYNRWVFLDASEGYGQRRR
jgi:hypothetical protein